MIANAFAKGPAFIAYLTLGDGGLDYSLSSALALVKGGVDLLEIGLPFTDPVADGPVIQKAMQRSLDRGTKAADLIPFLQALRKETDVPVILFSYYNPILALGKTFRTQAKQAGASGMLIVDLPFELMPESDLDPILVISTSTPQERVEQITKKLVDLFITPARWGQQECALLFLHTLPMILHESNKQVHSLLQWVLELAKERLHKKLSN